MVFRILFISSSGREVRGKGEDTVTGRVTRITSDNASDYYCGVWTQDGHILADHVTPRASIWRFQPQR